MQAYRLLSYKLAFAVTHNDKLIIIALASRSGLSD